MAREGIGMLTVTMVQHVNVQITDRQRTREWYERILGARFRDRGPERNKRQLQLHIGNAEMHFSETDNPVISSRAHFALEVENWDDTLAHLDALGIAYSRAGQVAPTGAGTEGDQRWSRRDDTGEHSTYIHDPDGNRIELVYHPLGLVDGDGHKVEVVTHPRGVRWRQLPDVEAALGKASAS
jgi:catechol 2,3-dioxygenase-like lactoylglutathione lyase family enzyme